MDFGISRRALLRRAGALVALAAGTLVSPVTAQAGSTARPPDPRSGAAVPGAPGFSVANYRGKWIEIDVTRQTLTAWNDGQPLMTTLVSTGTRRTPTVRGTFRIRRKVVQQRMRGPDYDLPNVPWVMYFYRDYSVHGTYWHNNFGRPMSHGCVNMPTDKAGWLFQWAPKGTRVVVR
jgi:lipoprotein-anchoring transpeptidase ErfK/SrfK